MFKVDIDDIPRESSLVCEVELDAEQLSELFTDVEEFDLVEPEAFESRVRLQRIDDSIRLSGFVATRVAFDCGRCLGSRVVDVDAELEYLLMPREAFSARYVVEQEDDEGEELELTEADLDVHYYEGEELDVRPFLREALLLELPVYALCPASLEEECQRDYEANIGQQALEENEAEGLDPRWAKLRELKKKMESN